MSETPEEFAERQRAQYELARALAELLPDPSYVEPAPLRNPAREPCVVLMFPRRSQSAADTPVETLREGAEESGALVQLLQRAAGASMGGVVILPEDGLEWTIETVNDRAHYKVHVRAGHVLEASRLLVIDDDVVRGEVESVQFHERGGTFLVRAEWLDDAMRDGTTLELRLVPSDLSTQE